MALNFIFSTVNRIMNAPYEQRIANRSQIEFLSPDLRDQVAEDSIIAHSRAQTCGMHNQALVRGGWHVGGSMALQCGNEFLHMDVEFFYRGAKQGETHHVLPMGLQLSAHLFGDELELYRKAAAMVIASPAGQRLRLVMGNLKIPEPRQLLALPNTQATYSYLSSSEAKRLGHSLIKESPLSFHNGMLLIQAPMTTPDTSAAQTSRLEEASRDEQSIEERSVVPENYGCEYHHVIHAREDEFARLHPTMTPHASDIYTQTSVPSTDYDGLLPPIRTNRGLYVDRLTRMPIAAPPSIVGTVDGSSIGFGDDNLSVIRAGLRAHMASELKAYKAERTRQAGPSGRADTLGMLKADQESSGHTSKAGAATVDGTKLVAGSISNSEPVIDDSVVWGPKVNEAAWKIAENGRVWHDTVPTRLDPVMLMKQLREENAIQQLELDEIDGIKAHGWDENTLVPPEA